MNKVTMPDQTITLTAYDSRNLYIVHCSVCKQSGEFDYNVFPQTMGAIQMHLEGHHEFGL